MEKHATLKQLATLSPDGKMAAHHRSVARHKNTASLLYNDVILASKQFTESKVKEIKEMLPEAEADFKTTEQNRIKEMTE